MPTPCEMPAREQTSYSSSRNGTSSGIWTRSNSTRSCGAGGLSTAEIALIKRSGATQAGCTGASAAVRSDDRASIGLLLLLLLMLLLVFRVGGRGSGVGGGAGVRPSVGYCGQKALVNRVFQAYPSASPEVTVGLARPLIVGHSMGVYTAIELAAGAEKLRWSRSRRKDSGRPATAPARRWSHAVRRSVRISRFG